MSVSVLTGVSGRVPETRNLLGELVLTDFGEIHRKTVFWQVSTDHCEHPIQR